MRPPFVTSYDEEDWQWVSGVEFGWDKSVMVHRLALIVGKNVRVGRYSRIDAFTVLTGRVTLGERVHIGTGACIFGTYGVSMGDCSTLSPGAKIFTATDAVDSAYLGSPLVLEREMKYGGVIVGAFSVVGANSVVLPLVGIGEEVQIASNSTVTKRVPDGQVWGGNPARYIKDRAQIDRQKAMG